MGDQTHFSFVFFFICGLVFVVIGVDVAVMFIPIPAGGQKYADLLIGGLNTGALMTGIQYLLGGNPLAKKSADGTQVTGDNNKVITPPTEVQ